MGKLKKKVNLGVLGVSFQGSNVVTHCPIMLGPNMVAQRGEEIGLNKQNLIWKPSTNWNHVVCFRKRKL